MAITSLSMLIFLVTWAYVGPCDWIGRLEFNPPPVIAYPGNISNLEHNDTVSTFAVVGDTQRTSFWECIIGREVNDKETKLIIKGIADSNAEFLVFLGDMVFDGGNEKHWQYFDRTIMPLRAAKLPILPVLGNHEYWGNRAAARSYVEERFGNMEDNTWYSKENGPLGMIFVNSNHEEMSTSMWNEQINWLKELIVIWDLKKDIKGIVLFAHHPPYTNSIIVSSDIKVRKDVVRTLCGTRKALLMITGHAHGYERFENVNDPLRCSKQFISNGIQTNDTFSDHRAQPVQFLISGGGGGPRPSKLRKDYLDSFKGPSPRPFNFLLIRSGDDGINISVKSLAKGQTQILELEKIHLKYAKQLL